MNLNKQQFLAQKTGQQWTSYSLRATATNDIFVSGAGGELVHFNGSNWHLYREIQSQNTHPESFRFLALYPTKDFVLLGGYLYDGTYGLPIVLRGHR